MDLTQWDEEYDKMPEDGMGPLPIGRYQTTVKEARVKVLNSGDRVIGWLLVVAMGPYEGRTISNTSFFPEDGGDKEKNRRRVGTIKSQVCACGMNIKFSELPDKLDELVGLAVDVELKENEKNPKYPYVNFKKPITDEALPF